MKIVDAPEDINCEGNMKEIRCNNWNDKKGNFRTDEIYLMYSWSTGNKGKNCKLVKWTPKGFTIIMYVGDSLATNFSPPNLEHVASLTLKKMFFKLDKEEIDKHYIMEVI